MLDLLSTFCDFIITENKKVVEKVQRLDHKLNAIQISKVESFWIFSLSDESNEDQLNQCAVGAVELAIYCQRMMSQLDYNPSLMSMIGKSLLSVFTFGLSKKININTDNDLDLIQHYVESSYWKTYYMQSELAAGLIFFRLKQNELCKEHLSNYSTCSGSQIS